MTVKGLIYEVDKIMGRSRLPYFLHALHLVCSLQASILSSEHLKYYNHYFSVSHDVRVKNSNDFSNGSLPVTLECCSK